MTAINPSLDIATLESQLRARRLWYHDIELLGGLRTRFEEDYDVNGMLRRLDESCARIQTRIEQHTPASLAGLSVLDLGSADGKFTFWAARRGAHRVVGVERNRQNHERAVFIRDVLALDNVELHCGALERHCPDETFDLVFCLGLIYHVVDPLGTLHTLRTRCRQRLFITAALDLPEGDGAPLSRLDRYATGAHGLWSFNAAMVRQMLTLAGFEIDEQIIEDNPAGGRHFFAVASPGTFADHHIFLDTIDQEFPINLDRRRERVRKVWRTLPAEAGKPVAIFGAGTHTPWLLEQVADFIKGRGPSVAWVLDDRLTPGTKVAGYDVRRPAEIETEQLSAVVLSSWHQTEALRRRAREVFGDRVRIVAFDGDREEQRE